MNSPSVISEGERAILDSLVEGCQVIDSEWRYSYLNDAAVAQAHRSRSQLLGKTMMDCYPGIEATALFATLQKVMQSGRPERFKTDFSYPDAQQGWFELSVQAWRGGLMIFSWEVTQSQTTERQFEVQKHQLQTLRQVDLAISSHADLAAVSDRILDLVLASTTADAVDMLLFEPDLTSGSEIFYKGFQPESAADLVSFRGKGIDKRAMDNRATLFIPELESEPGFLRRKMAQREGFVSYVGTPVISNDRVIGILECFTRQRLESPPEWLSFFEALAGQTAIAVESKMAQLKAETSSQRLAGLLDTAMDAIITIDDKQKIILFNPAAEALFGYSNAEMIGQPINRLIPARFKDTHNQYVEKFGQSGATSRRKGALGEIFGQRADGEEFPLEASISSTEIKGKRFYSVILRDISERKRAEQDLRASEEQFTATFRLSPAPMVLTNLATQEVIDVNEVFCAFSGFSRNEIIGISASQLGLLDQDNLQKITDQINQTGAVQNLEVSVRIRNGDLKEVLASVTLLEVNGIHCALSTFIDITERNNSLRQLRATEEHNLILLQESQRRLGRTASLRTIDKAIINSLDLKFTLEIIVAQAIKELGVDAADILIYNETTHTLNYLAGQGFRTSAVQNVNIRLGQPYAGRVILERKPVFLSGLSKQENSHFQDDPHFHLEGFEEFHCVPLIAKGKALGVLETFSRKILKTDPEWLEYLETLASQAAIAIENNLLLNGLQRANNDLVLGYDATIEGWSRALELRDHETEGHTQRVTNLTLDLARSLDLSDEELVHIRRGALLHDIGKMGIPDRILRKPDKLDAEEWQLMKQHPTLAHRMLTPIAYLRDALAIPYSHHEKWDGSGYPRGLSGEEIPYAARIFAVADVYDALTSDRPYRKAWSRKKALNYIAEQAGSHFDPEIVKFFLKMEDGQ
ncbi:MAG: PAS domain S-box protein [Anaerolineales bacterium]|nr:MAG: PAS domain S-box protein [Anaerolineales bacterium]